MQPCIRKCFDFVCVTRKQINREKERGKEKEEEDEQASSVARVSSLECMCVCVHVGVRRKNRRNHKGSCNKETRNKKINRRRMQAASAITKWQKQHFSKFRGFYSSSFSVDWL